VCWGFNSGPYTCQASGLTLEPLALALFVLVIFQIESCVYAQVTTMPSLLVEIGSHELFPWQALNL
jgi:hypothetical protein